MGKAYEGNEREETIPSTCRCKVIVCETCYVGYPQVIIKRNTEEKERKSNRRKGDR